MKYDATKRNLFAYLLTCVRDAASAASKKRKLADTSLSTLSTSVSADVNTRLSAVKPELDEGQWLL